MASRWRTPALLTALALNAQALTMQQSRRFRLVVSMTAAGGNKVGEVDLVDKLFTACSSGSGAELDALIKLKINVNRQNDRGWTAMMIAARNGHTHIVRRLIAAGGDVNAVNSNGQTARDIAVFWNYSELASLLSRSNVTSSDVQHINFFCHLPLDRASERRLDAEWLLSAEQEPSAKYVLFVKGFPLVRSDTTASPGSGVYLKLVTFSPEEARTYMLPTPDGQCRATFLGLHNVSGEPWFAAAAVRVPPANDSTNSELPNIQPMKNMKEAMLLGKEDAAITGLAASLLDWQARCIYCESCGGKTRVVDGGHKRICTTEGCTVKKDVRNTSYPRVDPTVIMAVISPDQNSILLGHGKRHPRGMWSCLAGFMEPGENVEDAVRREVLEEAGVRVGRVVYHSSQPWPYPTQLMIGCMAHANTTDLVIDKKELDGAAWFTRAQAQLMSEHRHPDGFFFPPSFAIAHHLIKHWLCQPVAAKL